MIKKFGIFFLSLFIFLGLGVRVFAWNLVPISDNNINYGYSVSPSGINTDYLVDFEFTINDTTQAVSLPIELSALSLDANYKINNIYYNYYDFNLFFGVDTDKKVSQSGINYNFSFSSCVMSNISSVVDFYSLNSYTFVNSNGFVNFKSNWQGLSSKTIILNSNYNTTYKYHLYLYFSENNIKNIKNYYFNLGFYDFDINDYLNAFLNNFVFNFRSKTKPNVLITESFIYSYDTSYSAFIANQVYYYKDFLFDINTLKKRNLNKYGYGFFQSCFDLKKLNISGGVFDVDTTSIYPTFSNNMLYYVIPPKFPNSKFSDNIDFSSIELLYSFDYANYSALNIQNEKITGLFKNYDSLPNSEYIHSNFYSFGFSRCLFYTNDNVFNLGSYLGINKFTNINANAFYNSGIDSNSTINNWDSNAELANDLGLYKINCHWYDLKGQLNNLFYYLVTGLPFLNDLYLLLNQIFVLSKAALSTITFSSYLIGFLGFILCINIVFRKLLK